MAPFVKLTKYAGLVSIAVLMPMGAVANEPVNGSIEATTFVSSGRLVNVVSDATPADQDAARAAIWALTNRTAAPTCADQDDCVTTFQIGAK